MAYLISVFVAYMPKFVKVDILDDSNEKMNLFNKFVRFLEMFYYLDENFYLDKTNDQISLIGDHSDPSSVNCFKNYFKSTRDKNFPIERSYTISKKLSNAIFALLKNWPKEWKSISPFYRYKT